MSMWVVRRARHLLPQRRTAATLHLTAAAITNANAHSSRRSLSTQRELFSTYLMKRAKIGQILARCVCAYPDLIQIGRPSTRVDQYFAKNATEREKVFMYLCCLLPTEERIEIPEFLGGAKQAAHAVYAQLYAPTTDGTTVLHSSSALDVMASEECLTVWKDKLDLLKKQLKLPNSDKIVCLELQKLEMNDVRLQQVDYTYNDTSLDQQQDNKRELEPSESSGNTSVFGLHEELTMVVHYDVTEHVRVITANDADTDTATKSLTRMIRTKFEWSFKSNVSQVQLIDWYIAETTPFRSTVNDSDPINT